MDETRSDSGVKPARAKQALLAVLLVSASAAASVAGPQRCSRACRPSLTKSEASPMTPGTAIDRQIHRGLVQIALGPGGLSIKADLADRATIRRRSDQQQPTGVRQACLKPVVVIRCDLRLRRKAAGTHLGIIQGSLEVRQSSVPEPVLASPAMPEGPGCHRPGRPAPR